ncbi:hypothetical protein HMPREF3095_11505 [Lactobacillus sp. HMSC25A02]|nr:hypothetical protein HMPREF3095_11505 [Lactobacillus sp. HMSC25A02]
MSVGLYLRGQQSQENQLAKDAMPCQTPQSPVQMGWRRVARAVTALRAQNPVSKSPNNISDKDRRCVVCTAEPHLAYDSSALALVSSYPIKLFMKQKSQTTYDIFRNTTQYG